MKMLHLELVADSIIGGSIAGFISEGTCTATYRRGRSIPLMPV